MDDITQPTQQATQATQKYLIDKFSQEKIDDDVVCRVICTTGQISLRDLKVQPESIFKKESSIKKTWTFGRNQGCDYYLGDISRLSNRHFMLMLGEEGTLMLKDTSTNGTWLNGARIQKDTNHILTQGDEISVGVGVPSDVVSLVIFINDSFKNRLKELNMMKDVTSPASSSKSKYQISMGHTELKGIHKYYCLLYTSRCV